MLRIIITKISRVITENTTNCPILGPLLNNPNSMQPSLGRWGRGHGKTIDHYDNCFSTSINVDKEHYNKVMKRLNK